MKKYIVIVAIMLLSGCALTNTNNTRMTTDDPGSPSNFLGYQPIDPIPVDKVVIYDDSTDEMKEVYWKAIPDEDTIRGLLPLQSARVSVSKSETSGSISYLTAVVSGEMGNYTVIMDFMKYRVEDFGGDNPNEMIGTGRIGVGLRIKVVVETTKSNLNLGSLLGIGLEAKRGNLRGGISIDVVGIDSEAVTNLIPLTSEIDQTAIQVALQALSSIKTKIFEPNTKLTPHLIGFTQAKKGTGQQIRETVTTSFRKGILLAESRKDKQAEILSSIAPGGVLDKAKWDSLVDRTTLSDNYKAQLKALNNLKQISDRLDADAGMRGTVISALHKAL